MITEVQPLKIQLIEEQLEELEHDYNTKVTRLKHKLEQEEGILQMLELV